MSADVVTGFFCADYFSDFLVSKYRVSLGGLTAHCTCPAFQFFRGPEMDRTRLPLERAVVRPARPMTSIQSLAHVTIQLFRAKAARTVAVRYVQ